MFLVIITVIGAVLRLCAVWIHVLTFQKHCLYNPKKAIAFKFHRQLSRTGMRAD